MLGKFKLIWSFAKLSFYAHHDQFDVIRLVNGYDIDQVRLCWFISAGLYLLTYLYGIFGFECESRLSCTIDWTSMATSPYNAYHQMFPKAVWSEINFMTLSLSILCVGSWISLLVIPPIERRFLISFDAIGLEKKEQMCKFRDRFQKYAFTLEVVIYLIGSAFVYVHVFVINANYNFNWTSLLYWALFIPIQLYHYVVFVYSLPSNVILASRYVTIQQKALTRKLIDLNVKLCTVRLCPKLAKRRATQHRLWLQYLQVNSQICDLCRHVKEYARFWSPLLTILFGTLISIQCYIFYMFLLIIELSSALRFILFFIVLSIVFNELALITQCAAVVKSFKAITGHNRTFYQSYTNKTEVGILLARNLLKAENLHHSRLLYSYAFRMFGNYRITNKSFHIILSYISLFFLYIVKSKYGSLK